MTDRAAKIAELERLRKIEELETLRAQRANPAPKAEGVRAVADSVADKVEGAGAAVMAGPVGKGLEWVGDKFERYIDAPFRAGVTATNDPAVKNIYDMWGRVGEQFGEKELPTTKSGKELMAATGLSTSPLSESVPGAFTDDGKGLSLKRGGIADVSAAGVAGGLIQPSTWAIPGEAVMGAGGKMLGTAGKAGVAVAEKYAGPLARTLDKGAGLAKKGVFKVGEFASGLDAKKAFEASERLSGGQMLLPEAYMGKAGKAVGEARDAIPKDVIAPGSRQALLEVREKLVQAQHDALSTPQSKKVLKKIDRLLESGEDVPLHEVDKLVRNFDGVGYTWQGNKRSLDPMWQGPVSEMRGQLNDLLPATAEGAALQAVKTPFADLQTATGKGQASKLRTIMARASGIPAVAGAVLLKNPVVAAAAATAAASMTPRAYYATIGAAKLPKSMVTALMDSYSTGKIAVIKDTMVGLAEKYPEEISRLATTLANYSEESARAVADKDDAVNRRIRRMGE